MKGAVNTAKEEVYDDLDESTSYRYVRFLPEYSWMTWQTKLKPSPLNIYRGSEDSPVSIIQDPSGGINGVTFIFVPDF